MTLKVGDTAPNVEIKIDDHKYVKISDFLGKKVILYFYPKDNTPGCTKEACSFRDNHKKISKKNAIVIGISKDSIRKHFSFRDKFNLPFSLGSDENAEICETYGVWKEKSMYGKTYMGIQRTTFLIDENGKIEHIWDKFQDLENHAEEILAEL